MRRIEDNTSTQIYITLSAQFFLAVVNFIALSLMTFRLDAAGHSDNLKFITLLIIVIVVTLVLMGLGCSRFYYWFLGGIFIWVAAAIAGANHVPVRGALWSLDFGILNYFGIAMFISILQFFIWILIKTAKLIKLIVKKIKRRKVEDG